MALHHAQLLSCLQTLNLCCIQLLVALLHRQLFAWSYLHLLLPAAGAGGHATWYAQLLPGRAQLRNEVPSQEQN
jgi:hypothetical protein